MKWVNKFFKKISRAFNAFSEDECPRINSLVPNLSREHLKRNCRIIFIDDEKLELVDDLKKEGFSAEQDFSGDNIQNIEKGYYDLIILDYNGVGKRYGEDQGLALLKSIKRVNPSVYVLAYTTQNLSPEKSSEFYTLTDGTLNKDLGVGDSISRIEDALKDAVRPERLWLGILKCKSIPPASKQALELERKVMKAILNAKQEEVNALLGDSLSGGDGKDLILFLAKKLIELKIAPGLA